VLEEAGRLSEQLLAPTNGPADEEGCHFDKATQTVTTPKGFKEAFKQFAEGGWTGLTNPEEYGGQALPAVLGTATTEIFQSGNLAWSLYPLLSEGPATRWKCTVKNGSASVHEADRRRPLDRHHVPDRAAGRFRPGPAEDARRAGRWQHAYKITGTKIFISAGEHDLTENIVHWCWHACPTHRPAAAASRCSSCRSSRSTRTARSASATRWPPARSNTRWASTRCSTCVMNFDGAEGF
jgi:alkylation response protein AidB-like acyl-CoA dehydrogenase